MKIFLLICAAVCGLAAIQERRDYVRCFGFVIFGILLLIVGLAIGNID